MIGNPVNSTQRAFNKLFDRGTPNQSKIRALLRQSGQHLNEIAFGEITEQLSAFPTKNPWHVCFAVGLSWGHLAKLDLTFTDAATNLLEDWNDADLRVARAFHLERGPEPIEQSLSGGHTMFRRVKLPDSLPNTLELYRDAQTRWLRPLMTRERPRYIGSWNATALFMVALFADKELAAKLITPEVMLPPGGPIFNGLTILRRARMISDGPFGGELDDAPIESGVIYLNNQLFVEVLGGDRSWNMLDVHSGLYLLGTRHMHSNQWSPERITL